MKLKVSKGESSTSDSQRINLQLMTEWLDVEMNDYRGLGKDSSYDLELINIVQHNPYLFSSQGKAA